MNRTEPHALHQCLELQREAYRRQPYSSFAERRADLIALQSCLIKNRERICAAISEDFGYRSPHETRLTEILPVLREIDHVLANLRHWMAPKRVGIDRIAYGLASNRILPQPLGVVGVIVPWNFPVNLSFAPLVSIFAAGNRAMVKMSEHSRRLARLLAEITREHFAPDKLLIIDDPGDLGPVFSSLPFDHLLFTGSTDTGRRVAAAAAANLCPVTLELGGRSPAVVCDDFDVSIAAERIMQAKCLNAGQICVTVDHVYVPRGQVPVFIDAARAAIVRRYAHLASPDYTSLIHSSAFVRLTAMLDQAQGLGAQIVPLMPPPLRDAEAHRLAPHLVIDPPADSRLMQGEIFGPILPVLPYDSLESVLETLQHEPRPLAFYPFTHNRQRLNELLNRVMSGGVSVNDAIFHVSQSQLPFGGVGASGMGHYHGEAGFVNFSKLRPVFHQSRWAVTRLIEPPYGRTMAAILRWFRS